MYLIFPFFSVGTVWSSSISAGPTACPDWVPEAPGLVGFMVIFMRLEDRLCGGSGFPPVVEPDIGPIPGANDSRVKSVCERDKKSQQDQATSMDFLE